MVLIFGAPVAHVMVIKFSRLLIGQSGPHKTWSSGKGREPAFRQETGRVCSASDGKPFIRAGVLWPEGQAGPLCGGVSRRQPGQWECQGGLCAQRPEGDS